MVKKIVIAVVGLLALFLLIVSLQPSSFRIARSAEIHAPPAVVFNILNDLHQGGRWSPFEKLDPTMKRTFSGPESGPGAHYEWDGSEQAGAGSMTIEEARPDEFIRVKLDFTRPMAGTSEIKYELTPSSEGTKVTWSMEGKSNFLGKAICMFMDMDDMIGSKFENGLRNLDEVAQEEAKKPIEPESGGPSDSPTPVPAPVSE
ncbi:SRPBCC family protein [Planctomicrobium sp. SH661]|uniref:SRPBCC family protein n=1 Tax=Planctomicrobium sp. SH661 TaxID=3448124 RepID=UPI003F5B17B9